MAPAIADPLISHWYDSVALFRQPVRGDCRLGRPLAMRLRGRRRNERRRQAERER